MINIDDVKAVVASLGGFDDDTIAKYLSVVENAVLCISDMVKDESLCSDHRVVYLAGVKACNDISLVEKTTGDATSFKVGDISITEGASSKASFKELYQSALEACSGLIINSDGFAFLNV